ncbi:MAG: zinc-ribbon domain-containing protein [Thauera sp.]|nr:zinc-ribbon domain-containing protein [Thauera sp.]
MMITRCPACQTVFRLRPEQLHARGGEVRCGHCFHPFNALENTVEVRDDGAAATPAPPSAAAKPAREARPDPLLDFDIPEVAPSPPIRAPLPEPALDDYEDWLAPAPRTRATADGGQPGTAPAFNEDAASAPPFPDVLRSARRGLPTGEDEGSTHARGSGFAAPEAFAPTISYTPPPPFDDEPATEIPGLAAPLRETARAVAEPASTPAPEAEAPAAAHEPDLARLDANYGRPRAEPHPLVRALAVLLAMGAAALLAAQLTYLYRTELARALPGLRPVLSEACARFGCGVPYPRDAEHIAIEASDLQAEPGRPGYYLLQATLNNRADYPQQWPYLELTLTDAGDNPISRRVLPPIDWLPPSQPHEAFTARSAIELRIPFAAPALAPTGYRIYAFYP